MRKILAFMLLSAAVALPGCSWWKRGDSAPKPAERTLNPADFAAPQGAPQARVVSAQELYVETMSEAQSQAASAPPASSGAKKPVTFVPPPSTKPGEAFAVDAMVGQVNGDPIYASQVFELIDDQLRAMGKQMPPERFYRQALQIVAQRLQQIIIEALILGEAEGDLSEPERQGLLQMITNQREELVRKFGEGAEALADVRLRQAKGKSLEQELESYRESVVVRRYMHKTLMPKVNVTRKDIERYYRRHYEEFNPKPGRTYHMIRVTDETKADRVDQLLAEGQDFLDIAADPDLNSYEVEKSGFFVTVAEGEKVSRDERIQKPVSGLSQGQHTERIKFGSGYIWVALVTVSDGTSRPLEEVQAEIERKMRAQRYTVLTKNYHRDLLERGSYDPMTDMVEKLMDIAMNRYAMPAGK